MNEELIMQLELKTEQFESFKKENSLLRNKHQKEIEELHGLLVKTSRSNQNLKKKQLMESYEKSEELNYKIKQLNRINENLERNNNNDKFFKNDSIFDFNTGFNNEYSPFGKIK